MICDDRCLILEAEHAGRRRLSVLGCGLFLSGSLVSLTTAVLNGSAIVFILLFGLTFFVFTLPFLIVLAISRYHRIEINHAEGFVEPQTVSRTFPPHVRRFELSAAKVILDRLAQFYEDSDGMRLALQEPNGERVPLGRPAVNSDEVRRILERHLGSKLTVRHA